MSYLQKQGRKKKKGLSQHRIICIEIRSNRKKQMIRYARKEQHILHRLLEEEEEEKNQEKAWRIRCTIALI
jgi:hypothetical protein